MKKEITIHFAKGAIMPEVRGLIVAKDLEKFGEIVELRPDLRKNECLPSKTPLVIFLETEIDEEELKPRLVHSDIDRFDIRDSEGEESASDPNAEVEVLELIDRISKEFLLIDRGDRDALNAIRDTMERIQTLGVDRVAETCREGVSLLERLLASDTEEDSATWTRLEEAVESLQDWRKENQTGELETDPEGVAGDEDPEAVVEAEEPDEAVSAPSSLFTIEKDPEMAACFAGEASEHLETAEIELLTLETDPSNEESLNAVFRAFHTIKGSSALLGLNELSTLAHEAENLLGLARDGKIVLANRAMDLVFESVDVLKGLIQAVNETLCSGTPFSPGDEAAALIPKIKAIVEGGDLDSGAEAVIVTNEPIGEVLVESGVVDQQTVQRALKIQASSPDHPRLGEILVREKKADAKEVAQALRSQQRSGAGQVASTVREFVKVDAARLDRLIDMIGELVISESMVSQSEELKTNASPNLTKHLGQLDKITRELQEMGTSLRMVPIRPTFQKMARLVRDLAHKAGKKIEFAMHGEDTELDKTVVDKIGDPLVHMIRNSVDHGIEKDPAERTANGKPPVGRIELRAFHKGGSIHIEIQDDGKGLDKEAILQKAIERGLVRQGESLSDREIYNLIFHAGFSTAKKVTDVSGRGVGMDVVKKNIDSLRGQVEILSEPGHGTIFNIRLPLTLAIIDGMVVRIGSERYIIPTLSIVQSIRPEKKDLASILSKGRMLQVQGKSIPLFSLWSLFHILDAEKDPTQATAVVVEDEGRQTALLVDELIGQQQVVIKPLGEIFRGLPGVAGGAIMPDGAVGLILDVSGIIQIATNSKSSLDEEVVDTGDEESWENDGSAEAAFANIGGPEEVAHGTSNV
ncbi:MAG: chemotaxis protein CheW [Candidatus Omnitrophica bacterium]|nr:chemotaxis protein CheW [Candidatus Omnitrophota bacterium]